MARRFIIDKELNDNEQFEIIGEEAKHIFVLRHNVGELIQVNNKICEIVSISKANIACKVIKDAEVRGIPKVKITLYQAMLKADKMEYVIQKAVELGVTKVVPFISRNVVVKLDDKDKIKKIERFNKISKEASKQCGRSDVVQVDNIYSFSDVVKSVSEHEKCIVAYENETIGLKSFLKENNGLKEIAIIIGAEGGFNENEIQELTTAGCYSISLGDRILRAETASLNLISILMYELN